MKAKLALIVSLLVGAYSTISAPPDRFGEVVKYQEDDMTLGYAATEYLRPGNRVIVPRSDGSNTFGIVLSVDKKTDFPITVLVGATEEGVITKKMGAFALRVRKQWGNVVPGPKETPWAGSFKYNSYGYDCPGLLSIMRKFGFQNDKDLENAYVACAKERDRLEREEAEASGAGAAR